MYDRRARLLARYETARLTFVQLPNLQPHSRATAVLVDELDASRFRMRAE